MHPRSKRHGFRVETYHPRTVSQLTSDRSSKNRTAAATVALPTNTFSETHRDTRVVVEARCVQTRDYGTE
ncbi:hypothetical protein D8S78_05920 [Natrialba swarupiae]|nr:hypothetical protein [Natrialba swarupiae]